MGWNSSPGWQRDSRSHCPVLRCPTQKGEPSPRVGISGSAARRAGMRADAKDLPSMSVCLCPQGKDKDREVAQRLGREGKSGTDEREETKGKREKGPS